MMPIKFDENTVYLSGVVGVEEAEELYNLLIEKKIINIDASYCDHMHASVLQLVVGFRLNFISFPINIILNQWLVNSVVINY